MQCKSYPRTHNVLLVVYSVFFLFPLIYSEAQVNICPHYLQSLRKFFFFASCHTALGFHWFSLLHHKYVSTFLKVLFKSVSLKFFAKICFPLPACVPILPFCQKISNFCLLLPCCYFTLSILILPKMNHETTAMYYLRPHLPSCLWGTNILMLAPCYVKGWIKWKLCPFGLPLPWLSVLQTLALFYSPRENRSHELSLASGLTWWGLSLEDSGYEKVIVAEASYFLIAEVNSHVV